MPRNLKIRSRSSGRRAKRLAGVRIVVAGDSASVAGSRLVEAIVDCRAAGSASPDWLLMEAIPESSAATSASEGGLC